MAVDLTALKSEIQADPTSRGYASHVTTGAHDEIAKLLNAIQVSIQVDNFVTAFDIDEAVESADWPAANSEQNLRDLWRDILLSVGAEGTINANATNLKDKVLAIFLPGTNTRTNLAALQTRDGSRAEELFGVDTTITHTQVSQALAI